MAGEERDGWQLFGQAARGTSTTKELVADQGPIWVFRFHYAGRRAGELVIQRDELQRSGWRIEVPPSVAERLRHMGLEPPPDR